MSLLPLPQASPVVGHPAQQGGSGSAGLIAARQRHEGVDLAGPLPCLSAYWRVLPSARDLPRISSVRHPKFNCRSSGQAALLSVPPGDLGSPTTGDLTVESHSGRYGHQPCAKATPAGSVKPYRSLDLSYRLQRYGPIYKKGIPGKEVVVVTEPGKVQVRTSTSSFCKVQLSFADAQAEGLLAFYRSSSTLTTRPWPTVRGSSSSDYLQPFLQVYSAYPFYSRGADWGEGVSTLLGPGAIANRQGGAHKASRRALTKVGCKQEIQAI